MNLFKKLTLYYQFFMKNRIEIDPEITGSRLNDFFLQPRFPPLLQLC